jgi:hypothetical protein
MRTYTKVEKLTELNQNDATAFLSKRETFYSKEVNYALSLDDWQSGAVKEARVLEAQDFEHWKGLRTQGLFIKNT